MPDDTDIQEVEVGKKPRSRRRRFDKRDWATIAEATLDELSDRKRNRAAQERDWKEIDRQVRMEPDVSFKMLENSDKIDPDKAWMAEMEEPLQAQTLEILTADASRLMLAEGGPWYAAHAALTDDYLDRIDFQSIITGDRNEVGLPTDQDAADAIVVGIGGHWRRQYDFAGHLDLITGEAFKYGVGVGRVRLVTKQMDVLTSSGIQREKVRFPALIPRCIYDVYLDDSEHAVMNEGHVVGPSIITEKSIKLTDLIVQANKGSNDPNNEDGGWMPQNLKDIEAKSNETVDLVEVEGDLIVPRQTVASIFIPGAVVTIAVGKGGNAVVRFRFRKLPFSSWVTFPYHRQFITKPYGVGPLGLGRPLQLFATDALNRLMDAAALKNQPPIGYPSDDPTMRATGGPVLAPGVNFPTTDDIQIHSDIGDPATMALVYTNALQKYSDLVAVTPARIGAQTVSHTTLGAKQIEVNRGAARTVKFATRTGKGPLTRFLHMEYELGRRSISGRQTVYLDPFRAYVDITRDHLPDIATFEWFGAQGPLEEAEKQQRRLASAQLALQLDQIAQQQGAPPSIDIPALIQAVLSEGGWIDVDALAPPAGASGGGGGAPGPTPILEGNPGAATVALQAVGGGQG